MEKILEDDNCFVELNTDEIVLVLERMDSVIFMRKQELLKSVNGITKSAKLFL